MSIFTDLRNTVFLRRISRTLVRIADALEADLAISHPGRVTTGPKLGVRRQPRLSAITHPSVEQWNEEWSKTHPAEEE